MSSYIYLPSAVKHFRRFAEEMRAEAREFRKEARRMKRVNVVWDQGLQARHDALIEKADLLDSRGKDLKALASDVLNHRTPIL